MNNLQESVVLFMQNKNVFNLDQEHALDFIKRELIELGYNPTDEDVYNVWEIVLELFYYVRMLKDDEPTEEAGW